MQDLSKQNVVNLMASELADRRRAANARRVAYLALAHAIVADEPEVRLACAPRDRRAAALVHSSAYQSVA